MCLRIEFTGQLTVLAHIVGYRRPLARGLIAFGSVSDPFYAALDAWSTSDYLKNWILAHELMEQGREKIIIVHSFHPTSIAAFCEAYVGWRVGLNYVFQDIPVEVVGKNQDLIEGRWDSLVRDYSPFSSDEPNERNMEWVVSPEIES